MADFVHLHVHSLYSLLEGAIRLKPLMERIKAGGMGAVAVTDTANLFGAVRFQERAKEAGVKPIFGSELLVDTGLPDRPESRLVLLAKDRAGYRNLSNLVSLAHLEGHLLGGKKPRVTRKQISDHSEGLFALSAGLEGEPGMHLCVGDVKAARETASEYRDMFPPGHYHLELQHTAHPDQRAVNDTFKELSRELKVPLVATCNCHYLDRREARAHDALLAIQHQVSVDEMRKSRPFGDEQYVRSFEEMLELFEDAPDAVYRSAEIAEQCNVELETGKTYLPHFQVPTEYGLDGWLRKISAEGLDRRFEELADKYEVDEREYRARLDRELDVIIEMGFPGYFLIVHEFIDWAKKEGIPVGPGRGSGAGSLVAFALRITDIDPIPLGLLFERFLNPERVSMPDFDIDFCPNRRDKVIAHVTEKYGTENVGQIITFGQLGARSAIRDVARVMKFPVSEGDRIAKLVPKAAETIPEAMRMEPRLKSIYDDRESPMYRELLDVAISLEGLNRQAGIHAAGVVIGDKPLREYVPLFRGNDGEVVTQFDKDDVEKAGLVKFDFLGLKTLSVIDQAVRLINRDLPPEDALDIEGIPLDDPEVFALISRGDTTGVFQFESTGFKDLLKKLKPDRFTDIVAAGAIHRPGPLQSGMVDDYIARKHGRAEVAYPHPALQEILEETYGVIIYQEQVMKISQVLAGYSLGRADQLRRAMGKKKAAVMDAERPAFFEGARARNVDEKVAGEIFDLMAKFAEYGFNKSHSAAYGLITYQTAWLKAHYPVEFMAALLTSEMDKTEKLVAHIAETRRDMGLEILPPTLNDSDLVFDVAPPGSPGGNKRIRFGLGAIKGVGRAAIQAILEAREDGPFLGLFDFCERVNLRRVNKRALEVLVAAGCFDFVGVPRWRLFESIERAVDRGTKIAMDRAAGQSSLFGTLGSGRASREPGESLEGPDLYQEVHDDEGWTEREQLAREKEALGFYISGHPLDSHATELSRRAVSCRAAKDSERWQELTVGGVVTALQERMTKKGQRMAVFTLEDMTGIIECRCFSEALLEYEPIIKSDDAIIVRGKARLEGDSEEQIVRVGVESVEKLEDVREREARLITVTVSSDDLTRESAKKLQELLSEHPGKCRTYLRLRSPNKWETLIRLNGSGVRPADGLLASVDRLFGARVTQVE